MSSVDSPRARVPCSEPKSGEGDASPAAQAWLLRGAVKAALQLTGSRARCRREAPLGTPYRYVVDVRR